MPEQSLAARAGLTTGLEMPSIFSAPSKPIEARGVVPYITFAHPKRADEWKKLMNEYGDVNEGEMFLVESGQVTYLDPAKLAWVAGEQFWVMADATGNLQQASDEEMPRPFKERIESVCILYLEDRMLPVNITWRSTKCPAGKELYDAYEDCQKPTWADRSAEHRESLAAPQPWMRFYGNVTIGAPRTSKSTGMPYRPSQCAIKPTGLPEFRLIQAFNQDKEAQAALNAAADMYSRRIAEIKSKLVKKQ
jgi:hypothetical protein